MLVGSSCSCPLLARVEKEWNYIHAFKISKHGRRRRRRWKEGKKVWKCLLRSAPLTLEYFRIFDLIFRAIVDYACILKLLLDLGDVVPLQKKSTFGICCCRCFCVASLAKWTNNTWNERRVRGWFLTIFVRIDDFNRFQVKFWLKIAKDQTFERASNTHTHTIWMQDEMVRCVFVAVCEAVEPTQNENYI